MCVFECACVHMSLYMSVHECAYVCVSVHTHVCTPVTTDSNGR